ncbi:MAG: tetratricopeptide repeat protein [Proteobacteria bacterium]|nr:tetratricopeptide repeat protein [Pseudomonadota bacterium]
MSKNDNDIQLKLEKALALLQSDQLEIAIQIFQEVLSQNPNQSDALHGLGMAYAQLRQFTKAVTYLSEAVKYAPTIAEFHNNLGNAYQAIGKIDEAMRHYHEALRLKGSYAQANNNLGTLLYRLGRYEQAAGYFEKSIRIDPHAIDTHYNLANCYIQLDRLLDAVPHYEEVLKIRSDHLGALHNLGITLCALKRFEQAAPLLTQVVQKEPDNINALFHLGVINSSLAKAQEAINCYEQVLRLNPQHAHSHHNLATIYLHQQQKDKALIHYQKALALEPSNKTAEHMIAALNNKTQAQGAPTEYIRALFDQYAYSYDNQVKTQLQYKVPQLLREAISPFVQNTSPLKMLDLGCGTGLCSPWFADITSKMIGVDISPNMIAVAHNLGAYHKLYTIDIFSFLESCKEEFNLIVAADVFVYFGELEQVFQQSYRILSSGGLFCFSIENLTFEEIQSDKNHALFQLRSTGRYAHHPDYIHQLCRSIGFKINVEKKQTLRLQEEASIFGNLYVLQK